MRVSFVSDVHGNYDGLARIAERAERLVVLGDLLDYVDYHEPGNGILGSIFGADRIRTFTTLRSSGDFTELHAYNRDLWETLADPVGAITEVVTGRYEQVARILPPDAAVILGNVDVEPVWRQVVGDRWPDLDGTVVEIGGRRLGFVAGGSARPGFPLRPPTGPWRPYVRAATDFQASLDRLGPVDVLCSHVPPDVPRLRYDTIPARLEMYGPGLLEAIDTHRPELAVFGHVHQPLARRTRRGRTECVNVGHFQRFPDAFEVHW
jgi:hypothetical protein